MPVKRTRKALLASAVIVALPSFSGGQDVSASAILQLFESTYKNMDKRAPDIFIAGYGAMWTPPPGRADQGGFSVGYDVYDRFDLGSPGNKTLYGTEAGLKKAVSEAHKSGMNYYTDMVWNHNGFSDHNTPGFVNAGAYPGFVVTGGGDGFGDFHNPADVGDQQMRLAGLIDIAQEKNNQYVRNPVPGYANNIPAGTTPAFGRLANVPTEANRRFYTNQQGPSQTYFDPALNTNVTYYEFDTANPSTGDPVSENATGYLMRHSRWMVEEIGVDGFRLDATKHFPSWVLNYFDQSVYKAIKTPNLDGSQKHVFSFGEYLDANTASVQTTIRKDINNTQVSGNRDALDFAMHYALKNNLTGNGLANNWHNIVNATQDIQDDGLANNGSQGVSFDASHDDGGAYLGNVASAYLLMRPGNSVVYMNAKEFGAGRPFPKDGRGDALGGFYGDTITKLVNIRNTHGRGNYQERWIDNNTLVYERMNSLVAGYNSRVDNGYDQRTVNTGFVAGTKLIELTGNATNLTVDPLNDIYDMVTVNGSGQITIRIPRNKNTNGVEHDKGYVIYGPATPRGTLSVTNVARTLAGETPTAATNGTARLASIDIITANSFDVKLATIPVVLPDATTDIDAGGDNAILRLDGGLNVNGNAGVDFTGPGEPVSYGFENFVTKKSPLYTGGDGEYIQSIDATQLSEGYHYVTARAFRHREVGGSPIFGDFRKVIYVDRARPQSAIDSMVEIGSGANRDIYIKSLDATASKVSLWVDNGAAAFTNDQFAINTNNGSNAADGEATLFKKYQSGLINGNHVFTIVTTEISYDPAQLYAGGGVNVQRIIGVPITNGNGLGLGDIDGNGVYNVADGNAFRNVLQSNNVSFNAAGDYNADGLVDEADNVLNVPWLTAKGADASTLNNATNLRLTRALALDGTLAVPGGSLAIAWAATPSVTGVPLTFTDAFNISANKTITKTGTQTLNINGTQTPGVNAALAVAQGTVNLNTNGGANLTLNVIGSGAVVNFGATQNVKAVAISTGASVSVTASGANSTWGGKVLKTQTLTLTGGALDLTNQNAIIDYTGSTPIGSLTTEIESGRNGGFWNGVGIRSSSAAGSGGTTGLAMAEASDVFGLTGTDTILWSGQTVDATSILIKYTWDGDADLSGSIDVDDYGQIDFNASLGGTLSGYYFGDFDYNGVQDVDDYGIIDFNVSIQGPPISSAPPLTLTSVPEPGAVSLLLCGAGSSLLRRRRVS